MPFRASRIQSRLLDSSNTEDITQIKISPHPSTSTTRPPQLNTSLSNPSPPLSPSSTDSNSAITQFGLQTFSPYTEADTPISPLTTTPLREYLPVKTVAWWKKAPSVREDANPWSLRTADYHVLNEMDPMPIHEDDTSFSGDMLGEVRGGDRYERKKRIRSMYEIAALIALVIGLAGVLVVCVVGELWRILGNRGY